LNRALYYTRDRAYSNYLILRVLLDRRKAPASLNSLLALEDSKVIDFISSLHSQSSKLPGGSRLPSRGKLPEWLLVYVVEAIKDGAADGFPERASRALSISRSGFWETWMTSHQRAREIFMRGSKSDEALHYVLSFEESKDIENFLRILMSAFQMVLHIQKLASFAPAWNIPMRLITGSQNDGLLSNLLYYEDIISEISCSGWMSKRNASDLVELGDRITEDLYDSEISAKCIVDSLFTEVGGAIENSIKHLLSANVSNSFYQGLLQQFQNLLSRTPLASHFLIPLETGVAQKIFQYIFQNIERACRPGNREVVDMAISVEFPIRNSMGAQQCEIRISATGSIDEFNLLEGLSNNAPLLHWFSLAGGNVLLDTNNSEVLFKILFSGRGDIS
jgi:hypothetical protein